MNILVTGAAGFIGFNTSIELINQGHNVIGIDNMWNYNDLKSYRFNKLRTCKIEYVSGRDIIDISDIYDRFKIDVILHLAALTGVRESIRNPEQYYNINTLGTLRILEAMKEYKINKIIMASSSSIYAGNELPFREEYTCSKPLNPYSASKLAMEQLAYSYYYLYGINTTILRYFTVYGDYGRTDMFILKAIHSIDTGKKLIIYGDGEQTRDFTYIADVVKANVKALNNCKGHEIYNIASGYCISVNDLIVLLECFLDKKAIVEYKEGNNADVRHTDASIIKAERKIGWTPDYNIEQGLKRTIEWYKKYKEVVEACYDTK